MNKYRTFIRTWWAENPKWPNGLEPCPGRKHGFEYHQTEEDAREHAQEYNRTHDAGRLSRKMEYESC